MNPEISAENYPEIAVADATPPEVLVSIIIPTYKEALNLPYLIPLISRVMCNAQLDYEIIVVDDDSQDGTEEFLLELSRQYPLRIIIRKGIRGLSSAVIEGFREAKGKVLVCMDADLSHPPEHIPALVGELDDPSVDFAIGSRYVDGGKTDEHWGLFRQLNSWVATQLARPFTGAKDPMAGFFALRRQTFQQRAPLSPIGYKIGLELIVKCHSKKIREIPIQFRNRKYGKSKLNLREQLNYLRHVKRLLDFKYRDWSRLIQFCFVGGTGSIVDLFTFNLCLLQFPLKVSRALAISVAMTWNFWLNRSLTFSYNLKGNWLSQYLNFVVCCSVGAMVNWMVSIGLISLADFWRSHSTLAAAVGILAGAVFNFLTSRYWVFRYTSSDVPENQASLLVIPSKQVPASGIRDYQNLLQHEASGSHLAEPGKQRT